KALHFERCQNEFVTESVNLKRKGTVERETFPRQPESVRLIKSHGSRGTLETEAGHARGALDDSKEINKERTTCHGQTHHRTLFLRCISKTGIKSNPL
ncbi:hypothetical protein ATANTOWER_005141, partial [Ataeniobius toweri]|nr:hypothetical protein [Ataeniobius toweri]